jgi:hypothetical protein
MTGEIEKWQHQQLKVVTPSVFLGNFESGGEGGILPKHPKKFSVLMVKRKCFGINERFIEKPLSQCHWEI